MWNTTTLKKTFKLTKLYRELNGKYYNDLLGDCKFEVVLNPGDNPSAELFADCLYYQGAHGHTTRPALTLLGLISSTLLHFGKASELALHSASATPGIASELALLSLCAMVKGQDSRFWIQD